ncbi:MAG: CoA-binding protein, partial [Antricoccus sp.]
MRQTSSADAAESSVFDALFRPRSIAIVGISGKELSLAARPMRYLQRSGFAGLLYPVNPNYDELGGLKCYSSLEAIETSIDLVLSMVPAAGVIDVLRSAGRVGARAMVVFASGFAETGPEGLALQEQLTQAARETNVRVLGPNCQGLINNELG